MPKACLPFICPISPIPRFCVGSIVKTALTPFALRLYGRGQAVVIIFGVIGDTISAKAWKLIVVCPQLLQGQSKSPLTPLLQRGGMARAVWSDCYPPLAT